MDADAWRTAHFEEHRQRLKAVAYRMLGSATEADDAVQEAWLRFSRADTSAVENLGGWLTTVVSRVCLTMLQRRRSRPESRPEADLPEPGDGTGAESVPEHEALLAESVGLALMVVLDALTPAERVALVLHDMFAVPFEDIAPILGRNPTATRQLASRARRRVRGQQSPPDADRVRRASLVDAFLAAARKGDFEGLLAVLAPEVVMHADRTAVSLGAPAEIRGADVVAGFSRRARGAVPALVDGLPAAVWMPGGRLRVVFCFTTSADRIVGIELVADPDRLDGLDLVIAEGNQF